MEELKVLCEFFFDEDFKAINEKLLLNDKMRTIWSVFNLDKILEMLLTLLENTEIVNKLKCNEDFIAFMEKYEVRAEKRGIFAMLFLLRAYF